MMGYKYRILKLMLLVGMNDLEHNEVMSFVFHSIKWTVHLIFECLYIPQRNGFNISGNK